MSNESEEEREALVSAESSAPNSEGGKIFILFYFIFNFAVFGF